MHLSYCYFNLKSNNINSSEVEEQKVRTKFLCLHKIFRLPPKSTFRRFKSNLSSRTVPNFLDQLRLNIQWNFIWTSMIELISTKASWRIRCIIINPKYYNSGTVPSASLWKLTMSNINLNLFNNVEKILEKVFAKILFICFQLHISYFCYTLPLSAQVPFYAIKDYNSPLINIL